MKRIFITGALGQLGHALVELMIDKPEYQLYLTDSHPSEDGKVKMLDITQEAAVESEIAGFFPDIIINCAALTAVDLCETEQEKAYIINALGPKYIAKAAARIGAKLVHISTDYVYDGQGNVPYTEEEASNPINVYGSTKNEGDNFVKQYCPKSFVLHTAWVYGQGRNFVKTMQIGRAHV